AALSEVTPEVAKALSKRTQKHLNLGIKTLNKAVAKELSSFAGTHLGLNSVSQLNPETARALGQFNGEILGLNSLTALDKDVAAGLATFEGELALAGLKTLTFRGMESLLGSTVQLDAPNLEFITVPTLMGLIINRVKFKEIPKLLQQAYSFYSSALTKQPGIEKKLLKGDASQIRELLTLSPKAAKYLAESGPNVMNFSRLLYLSEEPAKIISAHKGMLNFGMLEELSFRAARGFKKFEGRLVMTNLKDLDADVALALGDRTGTALDLRGVVALKEGVADALRRFSGMLNLNGVAALSIADAKKLALQRKGSLFLKGLKAPTLELVKEIVKHEGNSLSFGVIDDKNRELVKELSKYPRLLRFEGMTALTKEFAEEIGAHEGVLRLDQLTSLDAKLLPILAAHRGPVVVPAKWQGALNELRTKPALKFQKFVLGGRVSSCRYLCFLTEELAEYIVKSRSGELSLDFLQELTPNVAEKLLGYRGNLSFPGLKKLSPETARILARHGTKDLKFGALTNCPIPVLTELVKHKGWLCFDAMTTLTVEEGRCLGQHGGGLRFRALKSLPPEAAAQLAKHKSSLRIAVLEGFSDEALQALAMHKGRLHIDGSRSISARVAKGLRDHKGTLSLDALETLGVKATSELAKKSDGSIWFGRLRQLTPKFAKAIAPREKASLFFNAIRTLPLDSTKEIVKFKGDWLIFDGLTTLSPEQAQLFATFPKHLRFWGMRSLPLESAKALAKHKGVIRIGRVHKFPQETVKAFLAHEGERIHFHYLKKLTVKFAKLLAQYKGGIGLDDIRELSVESARELVKHKGPYLWITKIKTLSPELARVLSSYPGSLSLHGLEDISDEIAKILAKRVGKTYSNDQTLKKINSFKSTK
ncbi:MAG: hypothetical protein P1V97_18085, partial [Planctomycetota bacterium]|nr:hypothetical protein [Planctomycetota bacterium]